MNWLARLEVDADSIRNEGISEDIYTWHKKLWECYPGDPDAQRDFLTRIDQLDGAYRFWVMSQRKPTRPDWCPADGFKVSEISANFLNHRYYAFDLKANPVKMQLIPRDANGQPVLHTNGKRKRGKRIPLVKADELREWFVKKGKVRAVVSKKDEPKIELPGGFRIIETEDRPLEIRPMVESHFRKKEHTAFHGGVQFRGVLEVTDREHFMESYKAGIGSAKGFGFGLLLLAPINL
jgi:CRISPR system Cascade subunit CasE